MLILEINIKYIKLDPIATKHIIFLEDLPNVLRTLLFSTFLCFFLLFFIMYDCVIYLIFNVSDRNNTKNINNKKNQIDFK